MAVDPNAALSSVLGRHVTRQQAEVLLAATRSFPVPARRTVVREGDAGSGLYFLLSGEVEVIKTRRDGTAQRLATIHAPSLLGEMSLVTDGPHTATARALTDCEFRVLSRAEFHRWLAGGNLVAYKLLGAMAEVLARRLGHINERMLELSAGPPPGADAAEIERFREKLFAEWAF